MREIVMDTETTGLYVSEGHRLIEVAVIELLDRKPSGRELHVRVNPDRDIPPEVSKIHGITDEMVADLPTFVAAAKTLRDFIGNDKIIITCRTKDDGYTLDIAFMNAEMIRAGQPPFPDTQWINVRRWSEEMFGTDNATLDKVLYRYQIKPGDRSADSGHGALLDAQLLAQIYPLLARDYESYLATKNPSTPTLPFVP